MDTNLSSVIMKRKTLLVLLLLMPHIAGENSNVLLGTDSNILLGTDITTVSYAAFVPAPRISTGNSNAIVLWLCVVKVTRF